MVVAAVDVDEEGVTGLLPSRLMPVDWCGDGMMYLMSS